MIIEILKEHKEQYLEDIDEINRLSFSDPWSKSLIAQDMSNPSSFYAVATEDGIAVAYAGMTVIAGEANITNIAVHPKRRREHIGEILLEKLIEYCIENNLLLITLEVRRSNIAAISLYRKMGFSIEGERRKYYSDNGEDALIMTRRF